MMREYYSVIIALVATLAVIASTHDNVEIPTHCPEVDPINTTIHLKHEYDCTKFYMCVGGTKVLRVCPYRDKYGNRLHFNPKLQVCDWPNPKICNGSDSEHPSERRCPPNLKHCIRLPHESDCRLFYLCDHDRETVLECAPGLNFNPRTEMCDFPKSAGCNDTDSWTHCPPKGSHVKVYLPHECSCKKYYKCDNGDQILRWCPKGQHFDRRRRKCVNAEEAGCIVKPTWPPTSALTKCPPKDNRYKVSVPHERDCNLYYKCNSGEMILEQCRNGLSFNPDLGICDLPENIDCNTSHCCTHIDDIEEIPVRPDSEINLLPAPIDELECSSINGRLPHEKDCSLYYLCENGKKIVHKCPKELHFNAALKVCDWPVSAKCNIRPDFPLQPDASEIEDSEENLNSEGNAMCIGKCPLSDPVDHTVQLPSKDCNKFCKCSNGIAITQSCPKGLLYDRVKEVCSWPKDVRCAEEDVMENL